jgi:channel protein (hemolysin III family)
MPLYKPWELALDGAVHAAGVTWTTVSVGLLLSVSTAYRYCVYSACILLIFVTSSLYNLVGCGLGWYTDALRRIDQASIFLALGGAYTVFANDWRVLLVIWVFCTTGAAFKLVLGSNVEVEALVGYAILGLAPLFVVDYTCQGFPTLVACILTLFFGVVFGYMNNGGGGMALWHVCVLASSAAFWTLVYSAAQHGTGHVLRTYI